MAEITDDLVGLKQFAAFFEISVHRLKQLIADGKNHPARGVNLTPDLLPPKKDNGRYEPWPRKQAIKIKNSIIAQQSDRPDSKHDEFGRIVGKTYRTRRSER